MNKQNSIWIIAIIGIGIFLGFTFAANYTTKKPEENEPLFV